MGLGLNFTDQWSFQVPIPAFFPVETLGIRFYILGSFWDPSFMREWDDISYWLYLPIYLPGFSHCAIFFIILHSLSHTIAILSPYITVSFSGLTGWPGARPDANISEYIGCLLDQGDLRCLAREWLQRWPVALEEVWSSDGGVKTGKKFW